MFIDKIKSSVKNNKKRKIVLAEGLCLRVLKAAELILDERLTDIILIGEPDKIKKIAEENDLKLKGAEIIDNINYKDFEKLSQKLYNLKKEKGMSKTKAKELLKNPLYFSSMLVKTGIGDGMVAGAINSTSNVLIPAFIVIGTKKDVKLASSFFIMDTKNKDIGENGVFLFSDCGVNPDPNSEELAEIGLLSAKSFELFVGKPKIAFLSYSTKGSAKGVHVEKVKKATEIAKKKAPNIKIEGELQLDSAICPDVSKLKCKESSISGRANVLIFPNLDSGNIGYKLVQNISGCPAYGPIIQGLESPVNDLSRSATVEDIYGVILITALQAN